MRVACSVRTVLRARDRPHTLDETVQILLTITAGSLSQFTVES